MSLPAVVVTGADGFIGRNLMLKMAAAGGVDIRPVVRTSSAAEIAVALSGADFVIHLAGVNRPLDVAEFAEGNHHATEALIAAIEAGGRAIPIAFASTSRAAEGTPYGRSKKAAEDALLDYAGRTGAAVHLFRLTNVFGKWARPNYNSAVATFCHNIARGLPISVNDPAAPLLLVYIDDVVDALVDLVACRPGGSGFREVDPVYATTVGEVAGLIQRFHGDRKEGLIEGVGVGLTRALYATYVSSLPPADFSYPVVAHTDARGSFVEMLKTRTSGQFSYFTAHPGVTRGGHYHHTKTEKFLVLCGDALFRFRHMVSGETVELRTTGVEPVVVETIPGWTHDITNSGADALVVMLWANEIFDRAKPDTITEKV